MNGYSTIVLSSNAISNAGAITIAGTSNSIDLLGSYTNGTDALLIGSSISGAGHQPHPNQCDLWLPGLGATDTNSHASYTSKLIRGTEFDSLLHCQLKPPLDWRG